jgi:hypothetical protein
MEKFYKIESSKYNEGVFFTEYNGTYQLIVGQAGKDGVNYRKWVFPQMKDRSPGTKGIPMGVNIGFRDEAIAMLKKMLAELEGRNSAPQAQQQSMAGDDDDGDGIPF